MQRKHQKCFKIWNYSTLLKYSGNHTSYTSSSRVDDSKTVSTTFLHAPIAEKTPEMLENQELFDLAEKFGKSHIVHLCIGSVRKWSNLGIPLIGRFDWYPIILYLDSIRQECWYRGSCHICSWSSGRKGLSGAPAPARCPPKSGSGRIQILLVQTNA